jgi:hypothetical protein
MEVSGQLHVPDALPPGKKDPAPEPVLTPWRRENLLLLLRIEPWLYSP